MIKKPLHSFHIPVMGLAYTIDSPIRVAHYGISSVISIIDDEILEKMKNFYSRKFNIKYPEISAKEEDYRARRITDYLDLVEKIVTQKFEIFKEEIAKNTDSLRNFLSVLPHSSDVRLGLQNILNQKGFVSSSIKNFVDKNLFPGSIDVNIMTKVDKDNFKNKQQLPVIHNDAHASLRGFAKSNLRSSLILSAGMNPRLYSYIEEFDDFFPDEYGLKKKIVLKVSDFRSAMIQGLFLAKKGLWVSEYRIESGLNCGGHAFATDGLLLGPILEEFNSKKDELLSSAHTFMVKALEQKGRFIPKNYLEMDITVQGGIGTSEEHDFLLENYNVQSVGWGSPFLLVPEATSVDHETRQLLAKAKEKDFYLSNISPLGVPFNTVKNTSNSLLTAKKAAQNKFGSSCPKKLLALSKEYSEEGICTASKKYMDLKISELENKTLTDHEMKAEKSLIREKACLCVGLVNSAYLENDIEIKGEKQGVVICPGPNLAYFDKEVSLTQMLRHIYGYENILPENGRQNFLMNELKMYVDHWVKEINNLPEIPTNIQIKKYTAFKNNLLDGISYYENLFLRTLYFSSQKHTIKELLSDYKNKIINLSIPVINEVS